MPRSFLIIELASSALEVALCRGRQVAASYRVAIDRPDWTSDAPDGRWTLDGLDAPLRQALAELVPNGPSRVPVVILSSTPGTVTSVSACAAAAGSGQAVAAARLALASVVQFPLGDHPHAECVLHTDPMAQGSAQRIHTLAVADTDAHVATVVAWAEAAGAMVQSVIPSEAVLAVAAVRTAVADASPKAVLWVGTHRSVLAVGVRGRLEIVRTINAGSESLVEALLRPIRRRSDGAGEPADAVSLTRQQARSLLSTIGLPNVAETLPDLPGCTGASILPLLQPVVQRLAVEIKQSLRFGTNEADRAAVSLVVTGEGSGIPRLAEVLGGYAGISVAPGDGAASERRPLVTAAAAHLHRLPMLLNRSTAETRLMIGIRRGLLAGVAAAGVMLGIEAVSVFASLAKERERLTAIKANSAGQEALADLQDRAVRARTEATALGYRIARTLGQSPDWSATMAAIARSAPEAVRVLDLDMRVEDKRHVCRLRAYVRSDEQHDPTATIREFVESLGDCPIVETVRLGVTQRTSVRGHEAQSFELIIALVPLPNHEPGTQTAAVASDQIGGRP